MPLHVRETSRCRSKWSRAIGMLTLAMACAVPLAPTAAAAPGGTSTTRVIVRFGDLPAGTDIEALSRSLVAPSHGRVTAIYEYAVQGFAVELPAAAVAALARNPFVAAVTPDRIVTLDATDPEVPTGIDRIEGDRNVAAAAVDADIAVIDTGVVAHPDLNIVSAVDCTPWSGLLGCVNGNQGTVHWHATHVAGIAAARDDGVGVEGAAPGARIWSVRVLDAQGSGSLSQIIAGIDWVTARANVIDVANMSLGGAFSDSTFDQAISNSVAAGIVYVVAAGNDGQDAGGFSPAKHPAVLTVSAIADSDGAPGGTGGSPSCRADQDDTLADFSNFGSVVDVAAPGVCILSTMPGGGYGLASGTSMASPHAAGVVARYLAATGLDPASAADVANVRSAIIASSLPQAGPCGFTGDRDVYAEPLVFLNATALGGDGSCGTSGPANHAPTIQWGTPADGATVSGSVAVTATITDVEDPAANLAVDVRVNGGPWQPMTSGAPDQFSAVWDTTTASDGPATLEISATDSVGATSTATRGVTVDNLANVPPTAAFVADCSGLTCSFDGSSSTDADGTITLYSWSFGDGTTGSGQVATHSYTAGGTWAAQLTVTDNEGAQGSVTHTITVTQPTTMVISSAYAELAGRRNTDLVATVKITSATGPVAGATVTGWFEVNGLKVTTSGTTGIDGVANLQGGKVRRSDFVTWFCVSDAKKTGMSLTTPLPYCVLVNP